MAYSIQIDKHDNSNVIELQFKSLFIVYPHILKTYSV